MTATTTKGIAALLARAAALIVARDGMSGAQRRAARHALPDSERRWLRAAYRMDDESRAWLERHPWMAGPLIEAYIPIRRAYPSQTLLLERARHSDDHDDTHTDETHVLDEDFEQVPPDIFVDYEWFPEVATDEWGDPCAWIFAREEQCGPIGRAMHQEMTRSQDLLGDDDRYGRAEVWWSRSGPRGGYRRSFTPYGMSDFVRGDVMSNADLDEEIAHEQTLLTLPPDPETDDDEPVGNPEYLDLLLTERARRERDGIVVEHAAGLELTAEDMAASEAYFECHDITWHGTEQERAALEARYEAAHANRLAQLRALRDSRRAFSRLVVQSTPVRSTEQETRDQHG